MLSHNITCIIQARTQSSRLPNKILLDGFKKSLIEHQIERIKFFDLINFLFLKGFSIRKKVNIKYLCGSTSDGKKISHIYKSIKVKLPKIIKFNKIT